MSNYRGYLPIETLSPRGDGGSNYDPYVSVPKFLAELRAAIAATASIVPTPEPEQNNSGKKPSAPDRPARKKANKNKKGDPADS